MARADVRVRVRPSVIRVRISETALRAVIRVAAPKQQLIPFHLPVAPVGFRSALRFRCPFYVFRKQTAGTGRRPDFRIFQFVNVLSQPSARLVNILVDSL